MSTGTRAATLAAVLLALATSCSQAPDGTSGRTAGPATTGPVPPALSAGAPAGPVCQVGPDGGPVQIADRGIGGTGSPVSRALLAGDDRGNDRGIGGTGIVGVITGFASICLGGLEVGVDPSVAVEVERRRVSPATLRAGQVAVVEASGGTDLRARTVHVRYEVSGPVEFVEGDGGALRIAGQRVVLPGPVWGDTDLRRGEWAAVSGLRSPSGDIIATRLDRHATQPDRVAVRGLLQRDADTLRIGTLPVRPPAGPAVPPVGQLVEASGRYADGILHADTLVPDLLASDPGTFFDRSVGRVVIESYVLGGANRLRLGQGAETLARPALGTALGLAPGQVRPAIVEFERRRDGGLLATGLRPSGVTLPGVGGRGIDGGAGGGVGKLPAAPGRFGPAAVPQAGPRGDDRAGPGRMEPAPVPDRRGAFGRDGVGSSGPAGTSPTAPGGMRPGGQQDRRGFGDGTGAGDLGGAGGMGRPGGASRGR